MSKLTIDTVEKEVWDALQNVKDPEIPAISVVELGIITNVSIIDKKEVHVTMTPTFVGCPAIDYMKNNIRKSLQQLDFELINVTVDFKTQWSSNRISKEGIRKLKAFGLAPPRKLEGELTLEELEKVKCPFCDSINTTLNSPFGSTLCRAIHFCADCEQGFEQFKPL